MQNYMSFRLVQCVKSFVKTIKGHGNTFHFKCKVENSENEYVIIFIFCCSMCYLKIFTASKPFLFYLYLFQSGEGQIVGDVLTKVELSRTWTTIHHVEANIVFILQNIMMSHGLGSCASRLESVSITTQDVTCTHIRIVFMKMRMEKWWQRMKWVAWKNIKRRD